MIWENARNRYRFINFIENPTDLNKIINKIDAELFGLF